MTLFVCPRRRRGRPQNTNTPIFPQLFPIRHLCLYYSSLHKRRRRTSHITICSVNAALRACHALPSSSQPVHSRLHHNQCTLNWEKNVSPLISSARMCGSFPAVDCHAPAVAAVFFARFWVHGAAFAACSHGADGRHGRNATRWAAAGGVAAGWGGGQQIPSTISWRDCDRLRLWGQRQRQAPDSLVSCGAV